MNRVVWTTIAAAFFSVAGRADDPKPSAEQIQFFETKVRPVLANNCFKCHGADKQRGGLRLDSRGALLSGGDSGPAVVPGNSDESILLQAVNYDGLEMPPDGRLKPQEIAALSQWIKSGAPWPGEQKVQNATPVKGSFEITDKHRAFWSFQPVVRPAEPKMAGSSWASGPIDHFILEKLRAKGLEPSPMASRRELIRRAYFDLTGLPPTPEAVATFIADPEPDAYEKLLDSLLDSPQYGERWARHWLDQVRYAQTNGYERDDEKPEAWRYRDYVIKAFNEDKPYDRFVLEQLAGDELNDVTHDSIVATGFYRLLVWDDEPDDAKAALYDELDDIVSTTSSTFLGLTVGCARCHDHKFDPIPQDDYYQLLAFFRNVAPYGKSVSVTHRAADADALFTPLCDSAEQVAKWRMEQDLVTGQLRQAEAGIETLRKNAREQIVLDRMPTLPEAAKQAQAIPEEKRSEEQKKLLAEALAKVTPTVEEVDRSLDDAGKAELNKLQAQRRTLEEIVKRRPFAQALSVRERGGSAEKTHVLVRGNPQTPGKEVEPAFLKVLEGTGPKVVAASASVRLPTPENELRRALDEYGVQPTSGRRKALAEWIASKDNPLTARVMANRLWHYHFGRGIVATPSDFGETGLRPTHPELLDWLASELVEGDWRLKRMHKLIMLSSAYRQSSRVANEKAVAIEPDNSLLWRQNMRRLEAEAIRDSILAVSGNLNAAMGGRGIFPELSKEVLSTQSRPGMGWGASTEQERNRRSIYIFVKRTLGVPLMETFDLPTADKPLPARSITTIAPQALMLLNSGFMDAQAAAFADRILQEKGSDPAGCIDRAFQLALARSPTERESQIALAYFDRQADVHRKRVSAKSTSSVDEAAIRREALTAVCKLILNLNEFVYID